MMDRADVLSLEVGGEHASLRGALVAMGRDVAPPERLRPVEQQPASSPGDALAGGPARGAEPEPLDPGGARRPDPSARPAVEPLEPEPPPPAVSEWVTVELPKDETLVHIARRHLGDGNRFLEIMKWNGLSEAAARRLRPGHPIRIKRSELR